MEFYHTIIMSYLFNVSLIWLFVAQQWDPEWKPSLWETLIQIPLVLIGSCCEIRRNYSSMVTTRASLTPKFVCSDLHPVLGCSHYLCCALHTITDIIGIFINATAIWLRHTVYKVPRFCFTWNEEAPFSNMAEANLQCMSVLRGKYQLQ